MSATTPNQPPPTYYEILNLPRSLANDQSNPSQIIKRAYRRALLNHHPDKQHNPSAATTTNAGTTPSTKKTFSIDQVSTAYAVLSNTATRAEYDKLLLTTTDSSAIPSSTPSQFQTGIEILDLDDLAYDHSQGQWYRSCRCGNARGYRFREDDLEEAADLGELMVGCADCSLWLRVQFAVAEEGEEGQAGSTGTDGTGVR